MVIYEVCVISNDPLSLMQSNCLDICMENPPNNPRISFDFMLVNEIAVADIDEHTGVDHGSAVTAF
jgi:hypothetical protein